MQVLEVIASAAPTSRRAPAVVMLGVVAILELNFLLTSTELFLRSPSIDFFTSNKSLRQLDIAVYIKLAR